MDSSMEVPLKTKNGATYVTQQSHYWVFTQKERKKKILTRKDICTPILIAALFTIAKTWKQLKCPSTHDCFKMWCVTHIHNSEILLSNKKNEILSLVATWMDLQNIIRGEVSQRKTNTIRLSLICGI